MLQKIREKKKEKPSHLLPPMETFMEALEEYRPERPGYFPSVRTSSIDVPQHFLLFRTPRGKSLEAKSREFIMDECERIGAEIANASEEQFDGLYEEIRKLGEEYGPSQTYWKLCQKLAGRFSHRKISTSQLGIRNPVHRDPLIVFQQLERDAFVTEVLDNFHQVRNKQGAIPRLVSPSYIDFSIFYAVPSYNKDYGHQPKDESAALTLNKNENGTMFQDRVSLTTLGNFSVVSFPTALLWWYDPNRKKLTPGRYHQTERFEYGFSVSAEDLAEAIFTYKQAATTGHPAGLHNMGSILRHSYPELAFDFFLEAANRGDVDAVCQLGLAFLNGQGIPKDDINGVRLLQAAVGQYHPGAMGHLGVCMWLGIGMPAQPTLGLRHIGLAAHYGCPESAYHIGKCFLEGEMLPKDDELAWEWLCRAGEYHHPFGLFYQAVCYRHGIGTEVQEQLALKIFHRAADRVRLLEGRVKDQLVCLLAEEDIPLPPPRTIPPLKAI